MSAHDQRLIRYALLGSLACAAGFLLLALAVSGTTGPVLFDARVSAFVQGLPVPTDVWQLLSDLGGALVLFLVDVLVVAVLVSRRELAIAVVFIAAMIAVTVGVDIIKDAVTRPRPAGALVDAYGYSFPSGHAATSTVTYGLLVIVAWSGSLSTQRKRLILVGATLLVGIIGCSRIGLDVHYPTDVVAGWLGGLAILGVVMASVTAISARASMRVPLTDHAGGGS